MSTQVYSHLTYHQTVLYFQKFGTGNKVLLAFHGYGQNGAAFEEIGETLQAQYTVYSFDLFFHGKSIWPFGGKALEKKFWIEIVQDFLVSQSINRFSLAGYSMGGKFLLAILEALAPKIEMIFFVAPDGIRTSTWYSLATYPLFVRGIFKAMIRFPQPLFILMNLMLRLKIVEKGLLKFARLEMNSETKRRRVYYSWVVFRHLRFDLEAIADLINHYRIPTHMVLGKYDKIVTLENMEILLEKLKDYRLIMLDAGHNTLLEEFAMYLRNN